MNHATHEIKHHKPVRLLSHLTSTLHVLNLIIDGNVVAVIIMSIGSSLHEKID